jgi:hypothetical protein
LRNAYYRESKYTELFATVEDAREAAENNQTFMDLNNSLIGAGDSKQLLEAIKQANPASFKKIAKGFLDTVNVVDNDTFKEAVAPLVRRMAKQIQAAGKKMVDRDSEDNQGKALVATARNIMQFFFDDADEINREEPRPQEKSDKEKDLDRREANIANEKFAGAYRVAETSVERNLDKQILDGLDPDNRFNDFTRDNLLEKIKTEVKKQIEKDQSHLRRMSSLWKRSESTGYNRESLSRIVSAYLERARPIIPIVRNKYRGIAIKGKPANTTEELEERRSGSPRVVTSGRSGRGAQRDGRSTVKAADPKRIDYSKTSDSDIFEGNVKLKG